MSTSKWTTSNGRLSACCNSPGTGAGGFERMKALVKTRKGPGFVELREVPKPVIGAGEVLIEIKACGICGTDVHVLRDEFPYWPPVILGHEFSGQIVEVGP